MFLIILDFDDEQVDQPSGSVNFSRIIFSDMNEISMSSSHEANDVHAFPPLALGENVLDYLLPYDDSFDSNNDISNERAPPNFIISFDEEIEGKGTDLLGVNNE
ncbi:hypothetical protein Fot_24647 [Forsythia ovata]|uniref:Uncharacterized protein n=1 Tax=Forsythia ovata TaxID=205694 RepID=A0ABD1U6S8_9LAMI